MSRVLLVNDSRFESLIMSDALSLMGHNVRITDEYDAVKQVQSFDPEYVIVNYIMKEIRGDQLIGLIKLHNPNVKCLLSSSNPITLEEFRHRKVDAVLQTPLSRQKIEQAFRKAGKIDEPAAKTNSI